MMLIFQEPDIISSHEWLFIVNVHQFDDCTLEIRTEWEYIYIYNKMMS